MRATSTLPSIVFVAMFMGAWGIFIASAPCVTLEVTVRQFNGSPARQEAVQLYSSDNNQANGKTDTSGWAKLQLPGNPKNMILEFPNQNVDVLKMVGSFDHVTSVYLPDPAKAGSYGSPLWYKIYIPELDNTAQILFNLQEEFANDVVPKSIRSGVMDPWFESRIVKYTEPEEGDSDADRQEKKNICTSLLELRDELSRGWDLGVDYELTEEGARVTHVKPEGPASRIGILPNNVIKGVGVRNHRVSFPVGPDNPLMSVLRKSDQSTVDITFTRDGEFITKAAQLTGN